MEEEEEEEGAGRPELCLLNFFNLFLCLCCSTSSSNGRLRPATLRRSDTGWTWEGGRGGGGEGGGGYSKPDEAR